MSNLFSLAMLTMLLFYVIVKAEDYDDEQSDSDDNEEEETEESETNEIYNTPSTEKQDTFKDTRYNKIGNIAKGIERRTLKNNMYPYLVSIQKKGSHYTTGALLDKKWILTSAAEFYNIRETIKLFKARLGSVNCKKGGTLIPIKRIEIHPLYTYKQPSFDLAMLKIAVPFEFSAFVKPINLSKAKGQVVSAKFLTAYWPRIIINGKVISSTANERWKHDSMRISTQITTPWDKCSQLLNSYNYSLDDSSLCLKPIVHHHSPCMPDAGAPIIADDELWGITSGWKKENCLEQSSPTIFNRISLPPTDSWLDSLL